MKHTASGAAEERDRNQKTELKYLNVRNVRGGGVAVCAGGMAAEAAYNGGGSEEDISFGLAVANYERG